jgi:hypothetical protein
MDYQYFLDDNRYHEKYDFHSLRIGTHVSNQTGLHIPLVTIR